METAMKKLEKALVTHFKGADVQLRRTRDHRVRGSLLWPGFEGMPQIDRQVELRRVIDDALPESQRQQLSMILTLTPDEAASIAEG